MEGSHARQFPDFRVCVCRCVCVCVCVCVRLSLCSRSARGSVTVPKLLQLARTFLLCLSGGTTAERAEWRANNFCVCLVTSRRTYCKVSRTVFIIFIAFY